MLQLPVDEGGLGWSGQRSKLYALTKELGKAVDPADPTDPADALYGQACELGRPSWEDSDEVKKEKNRHT